MLRLKKLGTRRGANERIKWKGLGLSQRPLRPRERVIFLLSSLCDQPCRSTNSEIDALNFYEFFVSMLLFFDAV